MVKVIFLFRFRADRDPEEVRTWWLNDHGKIALRNLGMLRYVQNHFVGAIDEAHAGAGWATTAASRSGSRIARPTSRRWRARSGRRSRTTARTAST